MSANKKATVQLNRTEYERLRQIERSSLFNQPEQSKSISTAVEKQLRSQIDEMERRAREYQQTTTNLGKEIQSVTRNASDAIIKQQKDFLHDLRSYDASVSEQTNHLLAEQRAIYDHSLRWLNDSFTQQISGLQAEIQGYGDREAARQQIAEDYIDQVEEQLFWHEQEFEWERYLPGALDEIKSDLEILNNTFTMGSFDACILFAQQIQQQLIKARMQLEKNESQWMLLSELMKQNLLNLYQAAKENRTVFPVDIHGRVLENSELINVNYWSNNALKEYMDQLKSTMAYIEDENSSVTCEDMEYWLNHKYAELKEELLDIVMEARLHVLDSQIRTNIANIVIATMQKQGYLLIDIEDTSNLVRQPLYAKMRNLLGDEVTINLVPDHQYIGKNQISIQNDETQAMNEHEINQRRKQIAEDLSGYGIKIDVEPELALKQPAKKVNRSQNGDVKGQKAISVDGKFHYVRKA